MSRLVFWDEICKSTKISLSANPMSFCETCVIGSLTFALKITSSESSGVFTVLGNRDRASQTGTKPK